MPVRLIDEFAGTLAALSLLLLLGIGAFVGGHLFENRISPPGWDDLTAAALEDQPAWVARADRLNERFACSHTGLPDGTIPERAVVRVGDSVRTASLRTGLAVFEGRRPGQLISVCAR